MPEPTRSEQGYTLNPEHMRTGIKLTLDPVIADMAADQNGGKGGEFGYKGALKELRGAMRSQQRGWYGGDDSILVREASDAFFGALVEHLDWAVGVEDELVASLREYRASLAAHIKWVDGVESQNAASFKAIERGLDELGKR